jgi:hypothetical protein
MGRSCSSSVWRMQVQMRWGSERGRVQGDCHPPPGPDPAQVRARTAEAGCVALGPGAPVGRRRDTGVQALAPGSAFAT